MKKAHKEGVDTTEVIKNMKAFHVLKFTKAIMYIMHNTLGLSMEYLFVTPDEKEGKFVLGEILRAGNFGKYDNRVKDIHNAKGHLRRYLKREKLNLRLFMHNPREVMWSPLFNFYIHYFVKYWDRKMKVYLRK